ncbi:hypothetical protein [Microbacterium sp. 179-I 1D1 NHS]|uniref:hypothetical protein n=1 Tax=unclassified Microbacterium TaxID=2609290 RepID=UPI00387A26C8
MNLSERLVAHRRHRLARELLLLYGIEFPREVMVGRDLRLVHRGMGTVIHPRTRIGDRVRIFHQVTIGRADGHVPAEKSGMERIDIGSDVVLFPGAKVLGGEGVTTVGQGTLVAANAVLTRSTGEWEVWGGVPARKIADRPREESS